MFRPIVAPPTLAPAALHGVATPRGFLGASPDTKLTPFRGPEHTLQAMAEHALGPHGEKSMVVRQFTEWVIREVQPKDYLGELLAIRNIFVQPSPWKPGVALFRYANDPRHVEMVKTPERMVREIMENGSCVCDCDDYSCMAATMCLQIGREVELVAVGFEPGALSHVGIRAKEPKSNMWVWLDGVAGPREHEAAKRTKNTMILRLKSLD